MTVLVKSGTMEDLMALGLGGPEHEALIKFANRSDPLWAVYCDDHIAAVAGLIPGSILSDSGYIWLQVTPVVDRYKIALSRLAKRKLAEFIQGYTTIGGHCVDNGGIRFVRFLGAKFVEAENVVQFTLDGI